jgi:hypothetical protein
MIHFEHDEFIFWRLQTSIAKLWLMSIIQASRSIVNFIFVFKEHNWQMENVRVYLLLLLMVGERCQIRKRVPYCRQYHLLLFSHYLHLGPIHIFARHNLVLPIRDFWSWYAHLRPMKDTKAQNVHKRTQKTRMDSTKMCLETSSIKVWNAAETQD